MFKKLRIKSIIPWIMALILVLFHSSEAFHLSLTCFKSPSNPIRVSIFFQSAIDDVSPSEFFTAAINGMGINGDAVDFSIVASKKEYDLAFDFFMFELGTDIIFLEDNKEISNYIDRSFDTIIFQSEGVLLSKEGGKLIAGVLDTVQSLMKSNKSVLFVTNLHGHDKDPLVELLQSNDVNIQQTISSEELLSGKSNVLMDRTLMVVDRLDDDINLYKRLGLKLLLVLSGSTNAQKLIDASMVPDDQPFPHIIIPHVGMMKKYIEE